MMIRRVKSLGAVLTVALVIGAVAATPQAAFAFGEIEHSFTSDSELTLLTSRQEAGTKHVFATGAAKTECEISQAVGLQVGASADSVTMRPTYSLCKFGGISATVTNEGCAFVFDSDTTTTTSHFSGQAHAAVSLECADSHRITIVAGGCTIDIGDTHTGAAVNQNLKGVRYTMVGFFPVAITVATTVRTIKYLVTGFNCILFGLKNGETYSNGTYDGTSITEGFVPNSFSGNLTNGFSAQEGTGVDIGLSTP